MKNRMGDYEDNSKEPKFGINEYNKIVRVLDKASRNQQRLAACVKGLKEKSDEIIESIQMLETRIEGVEDRIQEVEDKASIG